MKSGIRIKFFFVVFLVIINLANLYAQTGTSDEAVRELERRRYETEKRLHEKEMLEIEKSKKEKEEEKEAQKKEDGTEPVRDETRFYISKITIENSDLLSAGEIAALINPFQGKEISLNDITNLVGNITNKLVEKGYITARVKVPLDQNLKSGVLVLTVVKGYIGSIKPEKESLSTRIQVFTAFPFLEGELLNIEDLDYGIEQMNKLGSNNATMKVIPGSELGFSDIVIYNQQGNWLSLDIGVDNLGQKTTGVNRGKVSAGFDNLLNINDNIYANYTATLNSDTDRKYNRSASFQIAFPLGYWSFSSTYSYTEYMQYVQGLNTEFKSSGSDASMIFGADRMLGRIGYNRFKARTSLALKDKKNYIEDAIIDVSSRKLTVAKIGLEYTTFIYGGYFLFDAYYNRGLELLGAFKDEGDMDADTPRAQFNKCDMSLLWNKTFQFMGQNLGYLFNFVGQWGIETLYSSEKISIGDLNTVRGFKNGSISGDRGFYIRNDFSVFDFSRFQENLRGLKLFAGYDYGYAIERCGLDENSGTGEGSVMGWAAGLSYSAGIANMSISYARQLFSSWFVNEEDYVVYFAASISLTGLYDEGLKAFQ
ncbi:MAG TPA: ShlB/FhaC/HecB family hemolysin secretion/activation protein [Spirochaetota bacterium]|nr:ShlB/FhaC/HecB family hemolysin secretion/activation protein [Spirochaetota bacterium]